MRCMYIIHIPILFKKKNSVEFNIVHCFDPENQVGTVGQFIYDLNCILDCRKKNVDVVLQLGYTSSSIWSCFFKKCSYNNQHGWPRMETF